MSYGYAHAYTYRVEARTRATGRLIGERAGKSLARPIETSSSHLFPISRLLVIGYRLPTNKRTRQTRCLRIASSSFEYVGVYMRCRCFSAFLCARAVFITAWNFVFSRFRSRSILHALSISRIVFTRDNNSYDLFTSNFFFFFYSYSILFYRFSSLISPSRENCATSTLKITIILADKEIFLKAGAMRKVRSCCCFAKFTTSHRGILFVATDGLSVKLFWSKLNWPSAQLVGCKTQWKDGRCPLETHRPCFSLDLLRSNFTEGAVRRLRLSRDNISNFPRLAKLRSRWQQSLTLTIANYIRYICNL